MSKPIQWVGCAAAACRTRTTHSTARGAAPVVGRAGVEALAASSDGADSCEELSRVDGDDALLRHRRTEAVGGLQIDLGTAALSCRNIRQAWAQYEGARALFTPLTCANMLWCCFSAGSGGLLVQCVEAYRVEAGSTGQGTGRSTQGAKQHSSRPAADTCENLQGPQCGTHCLHVAPCGQAA
jgi:hypothetical protein